MRRKSGERMHVSSRSTFCLRRTWKGRHECSRRMSAALNPPVLQSSRWPASRRIPGGIMWSGESGMP
eukprot:scaffold9317_cov76-Phaeocystis_antarctica.AAC.3